MAGHGTILAAAPLREADPAATDPEPRIDKPAGNARPIGVAHPRLWRSRGRLRGGQGGAGAARVGRETTAVVRRCGWSRRCPPSSISICGGGARRRGAEARVGEVRRQSARWQGVRRRLPSRRRIQGGATSSLAGSGDEAGRQSPSLGSPFFPYCAGHDGFTSDGGWREVGLQAEGASTASWSEGAHAAEEFPGGDKVQAAELPFATATLGKGARSLGGRIGTCGGPSRNLLDPPRNEGDGGRRFFGVLLQDDRCRLKTGSPVRMV
jgi:hypothetical protein